MKGVTYLASQAISLVENQAMIILGNILKIININIFVSLTISLLIGHISYVLAQKYYSKKTGNLKIKYSGNLRIINF